MGSHKDRDLVTSLKFGLTPRRSAVNSWKRFRASLLVPLILLSVHDRQDASDEPRELTYVDIDTFEASF